MILGLMANLGFMVFQGLELIWASWHLGVQGALEVHSIFRFRGSAGLMV